MSTHQTGKMTQVTTSLKNNTKRTKKATPSKIMVKKQKLKMRTLNKQKKYKKINMK